MSRDLSDWSILALDRVGSIGTGTTPPTAMADCFGGTVPFATPGDLGHQKLVEVTARTLTEKGLTYSRRVPAGSSLFVCIGATVGKVGLAAKDMAANQQINFVVPAEFMDNHFLYYSLVIAAPAVRKLAGDGALPMISKSDFGSSVHIKFPELKKQKQISEILSCWDQAQCEAKRLSEALIVKREWICRSVATGRRRTRCSSSEWKSAKLSTVLFEHGEKSSGIEPVYSVSVQKGLVDQIEHLGRSYSSVNTSAYNLVHPGDIVYTKSPTGDFPLGIVKLSRASTNVIVSPLYGVYRPISKSVGTIIEAVFSVPDLAQRYLKPLVQKGAKNTISITNQDFLKGEVRLPAEVEEAEQIAELIDGTRLEILASEARHELIRRQKVTIMRKLLSGEWRVPRLGDPFVPGGPMMDRIAEAAE